MQKFEVSPTNDLVAFHGKFGQIHIMSNRSRSKLFTLKMNDEIAALTFSPDGEFLYSHGNSGEVYIWDLKAQECVHKFVDDGCIKGKFPQCGNYENFLPHLCDKNLVKKQPFC